MDVKIKLVEEGGKALGMMPVFKTSGSACADSFARLAKRKFVWLKPVLVPLGICLELPCNTEAIVRGRSGNGRKGLYVVHGTIDEDYRGEVSACVWSIFPRFVKPGVKNLADDINATDIDERWESQEEPDIFEEYYQKSREHFSSELADIICCVLIIAGKEDIDIERAIYDCIEKNERRANGIGDKL